VIVDVIDALIVDVIDTVDDGHHPREFAVSSSMLNARSGRYSCRC
jgi:hypothetical protein